MTRIVCVQNKLLDFMGLQIQNTDIIVPNAKVIMHGIMIAHITRTQKLKVVTCPSNKMSKPRVK